MTTYDIEGFEVTTERRAPWCATCGDQTAYGETEQEAIDSLFDERKVRLRLMIDGKAEDEEWVSKRQLEHYWDEIRAHARAQKALIVLDHPASPIIHIFAY